MCLSPFPTVNSDIVGTLTVGVSKCVRGLLGLLFVHIQYAVQYAISGATHRHTVKSGPA